MRRDHTTSVRWVLSAHPDATTRQETVTMSELRTTDSETLLQALLEQRDTLRAAMDSQIADTVEELRASGASWTRVGEVAGISRQAARQRWGYLDK